MGAVAKSNMMKGFLIYEEMRKYLVMYEEAVCTRKEEGVCRLGKDRWKGLEVGIRKEERVWRL
jgi:hypothetical protein